MIGSFLTRGLVMVFGYAYPAYECYKTVERNKPDIEQLRFWCQYWILVAVLTVSERVGDTFISWVPMYSEAKLAFYIYLWYPKTKGTSYVYDSFFKPYVAKHETDIDRNLLELKTRAGDYAVLYWQRAASYGQTRIFEILQFIAAQSTPRPRPPQPQQEATKVPPKQKPSTKTLPVSELPPSPTSSASLSDEEVEEIPETSTSQSLKVAPSVSASSLQRSISTPSPTPGVTSEPSSLKETDKIQIEKSPSSSVNESEKPQETVMEEAIRATRGRLRKNRSIPSAK